MMILVGISVSVAINTGLFRTTSGVAKNTQNSIKDEQAISAETINIGGAKYGSLEDYVKQISSDENYEIVSEEITGEDGEFKYVKLSSGRIQIARYIGNKTQITIPAQYDGYEVYKVGNINAKAEKEQRYNILGETDSITNTTITSVVFEKGIKKIGAAAFSGCSGLTCELELPTTLVEIENYAFNKCTNVTGGLDIPKGVTKIGRAAFQDCSSLNETLILPDTLIEIGAYAFNYCENLTGDLVIPDSVVKIGERSFQRCSNLDGKLVLSNNLTEILAYTFNYCEKLSGDLKIPDSVTIIGQSAFNQCTGFTGNLYLPTGLIEIGDFAFNFSTLKGDLNIPEGVKRIGNWAFQYCRGFNGILTLPSSLEIIGDGAFNHCTNLKNTSLTIPKPVRMIGLNEADATHVFYDFANATMKEFFVETGNQHFKAIDGVLYNASGSRLVGYPASRGNSEYQILEGVTILDELVFTHSYTLKKIILPNSYVLTTTVPENYLNIGNNLALAIYCNCGIQEVEVKSDNPNYKSIDGIVYSKDGTVLWYVPEAKVGQVTIEEGITTIKGGAFFGYSGTSARNQTVTIPASVTEIEEEAIKELKQIGNSKVTFAEGCIYEFKENGDIVKKTQ